MQKTEAQIQIDREERQQWERALMTQIIQVGLQRPLADHLGDDTRFCPGRQWRADLLWPGILIVELDGGTWVDGGGAHNRGGGYKKDRERDAEAAILGYTVLRFTPWLVENGYAVQAIERWIEKGIHAIIEAALQEERERLALIARAWQPCWGADPGYAAVRSDIAALILED